MPGLIAFRRRWSTGSDDLVVPGLLLFALHFTLFVVISVVISTSQKLEYWATIDLNQLLDSNVRNDTMINMATCAHEIRNFSFGYLALIAVAAVIEIILAGFSMQGTVLDPSPRWPVQYLLYIRIFFGLIELGFSIVSAIQLSKDWKYCIDLQDVYNMQIGIIAINFIIFLIVVLVVYCVFDPSGGKHYKVQNAYEQRKTSALKREMMKKDLYDERQKTWLTRLSNCFCCVSNNSANIKQIALDEVATLLSNFFNDYDFVMSDIMAGLTLLRHRQLCAENDKTLSDQNNIQEFMTGRPITVESNFVDLSDTVTRREYEEMSYYCAYGLAAYGPLLYWVENIGTGPCGVLKECLCGENPTCMSRCCMGNSVQRRRRTLLRGNSGCGWALAGIKKSLVEHGVSAEVVYASFENDLYKQPFFLSVDHEKKTVVVTVRGTLAEVDALTDMVASPAQIPVEENDGTWTAHKGMVDSARYIQKKLLRDDMVLSLGFGHNLAKGTRDYDLILVGHSLGAGVASVLALLLRPKYPNLKCYAFSPPGGLLSHSAMEASKSCVQTLIFGKDVVPRLGIPQLERLRNDLIDLLKHTDLPKYRIILGNLCGDLKHRHKLLRSEQISSRALRLSSRRVQSLSANTTTTSDAVASEAEELYPPGRILHLVYSSEESGCCKSKKQKKYYLVYGDNTEDFTDIIVSHQMISHHLPQEVWRCMKKALRYNPNDRISKTYTQSATLPFAENRADSLLQKRNHTSNDAVPEAAAGPSQIPVTSHTQVTIESPVKSDDTDSHTSSDSGQPFLNTNQNNDVVVNAIAEIEELISSRSSSESSLSGVQAPLARPDSFTLSIPAHSPGYEKEDHISEESEDEYVDEDTEELVKNDDSYHLKQNNSLRLGDPQEASTPFVHENDNEDTMNTSLIDDSGKERGPITPRDVIVDMTGTSVVS